MRITSTVCLEEERKTGAHAHGRDGELGAQQPKHGVSDALVAERAPQQELRHLVVREGLVAEHLSLIRNHLFS